MKYSIIICRSTLILFHHVGTFTLRILLSRYSILCETQYSSMPTKQDCQGASCKWPNPSIGPNQLPDPYLVAARVYRDLVPTSSILHLVTAKHSATISDTQIKVSKQLHTRYCSLADEPRITALQLSQPTETPAGGSSRSCSTIGLSRPQVQKCMKFHP